MPRQRKLPEGMRQRGKAYYAWFRANGHLVQKKLSTDFRVACSLLKEMKARAERADFGLTDNDYRWDELKTEFLRWARQAVRNPHEYEADLEKFEEYSPVRSIRQIGPDYVHGFREWRLSGGHGHGHQRGVTPRTINRQVGTLKNMLNKAVEWQRIGTNPIADVKPLRHDELAKERRALTAEEVEALFEKSPVYLRPVWRMFMVTGIRRDELVNMKFSDVDFERKVVTVRAGNAKNHKAREIPLDEEALGFVQELLSQAKQRQPVLGSTLRQTAQQTANFSREHVFVSAANTPLKNNLLRKFYSCCKRAGIEDGHQGGAVDIHSLRVSFVTLCLENGAKPKAVQEIVGHSTLSLTMNVYAKATESSKRSAVAALPFATTSNPDHVISMDAHRSEKRTNVDKACTSSVG